MTIRDLGIVLIGAAIGILCCPFILMWGERVDAWLKAKRSAWHWRGVIRQVTKLRDSKLTEGKRGANSYGDTPEG